MSEREPQAVNYRFLSDQLTPLEVLIDPAELHGILCGKFCGGANPSETEWLLEAVEELDFTQAPDENVRAALTQMFEQTRREVAGQDFELQPLLPDDDSDLTGRVASLSRWCQGFLVGFGSAGHIGDDELSSTARETLQDLAAIGQVELDTDDPNAAQEAEANYTELTEYVRLAASGLFMEFGSKNLTGPEKGPTLH